MKTMINVLLFGIAVLFLSGCATILNERTQRVNLTTSTGQKVTGTIDGMPFEAPNVVTLTRAKGDKVIVTNDPKCNPTTIAPSSVDTVFFINILSGGLGASGSTTDYASEKMWEYQDTVIISCRL